MAIRNYKSRRALNKKIGKVLISSRIAIGLSRKEAALKMGMSLAVLRKIEREPSLVSLSTLVQLVSTYKEVMPDLVIALNRLS